MMQLLIDGLGTMVVTGVTAYSAGVAKSFIDRHPDLKELGWNGAIMWPVLAAWGFVHKMAKAGYQAGERIPFNPELFLPPPTTNVLMPGKED